MTSINNKITGGVLVVLASVGLLAGIAGASPSATTTAVTDGAESLKDELVAIATGVLPYAAAVVAIMFGWRLAKRFF